EGDRYVSDVLTMAGIHLPALRSRIATAIDRLPRVTSEGAGQVYASPALNKLLVLAEDQAKAMKDQYVSGEHFILSLLMPQFKGNPARQALEEGGLTREALVSAIEKTRGGGRIEDPE